MDGMQRRLNLAKIIIRGEDKMLKTDRIIIYGSEGVILNAAAVPKSV